MHLVLSFFGRSAAIKLLFGKILIKVNSIFC